MSTNAVTAEEWAKITIYPESTITCVCGAEFHSHAKGKVIDGGYVSITRRPCPRCRRHDSAVAVRGEPEKYSL